MLVNFAGLRGLNAAVDPIPPIETLLRHRMDPTELLDQRAQLRLLLYLRDLVDRKTLPF
jgi:hypothetical protein